MAKSKPPFLIRVPIWFAALASVAMYVSILLAILDIGPHIMGGERVTREEWLHVAAPLVAVIGVLMAWISYGFVTEKAWSRHVVIALFALIVIYASILGALNLIHRAIMWRAKSTAVCLAAHRSGIFISNRTSRNIFGNYDSVDASRLQTLQT